MTSQVKITAHCSKDKQVIVNKFNTKLSENIIFYVQDGETLELSIYDDWAVVTAEIEKENK